MIFNLNQLLASVVFTHIAHRTCMNCKDQSTFLLGYQHHVCFFKQITDHIQLAIINYIWCCTAFRWNVFFLVRFGYWIYKMLKRTFKLAIDFHFNHKIVFVAWHTHTECWHRYCVDLDGRQENELNFLPNSEVSGEKENRLKSPPPSSYTHRMCWTMKRNVKFIWVALNHQ